MYSSQGYKHSALFPHFISRAQNSAQYMEQLNALLLSE